MKIYIGHSSNFNFDNELYEPIKASMLWNEHSFILPHNLHNSHNFLSHNLNQNKPIDSKLLIKECDLFIAETSYPSIGLGIELGWANLYARNILCIYREGMIISSALKIICSDFLVYKFSNDIHYSNNSNALNTLNARNDNCNSNNQNNSNGMIDQISHYINIKYTTSL